MLERPHDIPVHQVLWVLLLSVGFPFFVLSANAPLLQKWFSSTDHAAARDPYFLYAASNAGSLLGLLAYPFWLEPRLSLGQQAYFWYSVYVGFFVVALVCGATLRGSATACADLPAALHAGESKIRLGILRRVRWIILSFALSILLLA